MSSVNGSVNKINSLRTRRGFSRRQKLIFLGMAVANLCLYGMMFLLASSGRPTKSAVKLTVGESLELQTAYEQSLVLALNWRPDAQLIGAAASWQLAAGDRLTLHRPAWSFSFYSPAAHLVQIVTVDQRGAQAGPQQSVDTAPQRARLDWSLDSDDLLLAFLGYGGQEFINAHPAANIHLQLKGEDADRSIWYVTAVDPVARQSLIVGVDACSRQVVLSETNRGGG
jgi:hypothetical protein